MLQHLRPCPPAALFPFSTQIGCSDPVFHSFSAIASCEQVGVYGAQNNTSAAPKASSIEPDVRFPLRDFFMKGLSLKAGIVNPKILAPQLLALIEQGRARPRLVVSAVIPIVDAPRFYSRFSDHKEIKVYINFEDAR